MTDSEVSFKRKTIVGSSLSVEWTASIGPLYCKALFHFGSFSEVGPWKDWADQMLSIAYERYMVSHEDFDRLRDVSLDMAAAYSRNPESGANGDFGRSYDLGFSLAKSQGVYVLCRRYWFPGSYKSQAYIGLSIFIDMDDKIGVVKHFLENVR